jgi:hypothetical protein
MAKKMKNRVEWSGLHIWRWFVVVNENDEPVAEFFDENPKQAKDYAACFENHRVRIAAAEEINEDGDLNPAVYDDTLRGAMSKLKRALTK